MPTDTPVLLVLDYPGRREEARIVDLGLAGRYDVRNLLAAPFEKELTAPSYAARLLDRFGPFDRPVTAVLAYCMAAPIAQEVVCLLSSDGRRVPMILFDGRPSTPEAIEEQHGAIVKQFAQQLGATAVSRIDPMTFDATALAEQPERSVEWMRRGLVELSRSAGMDDDDAEAADEMAGFYLDWLVYLVAAYNAAWPVWDGDVYHVMSRHHEYTRDWPGARSMRAVRVEATRNELFTRPEAARLAESIVDEMIGRIQT